MTKRTPSDRFAAKVEKTATCWNWTGGKDGKEGYGRFWDGARYLSAHRFAFEQSKGPIPASREIDHTCLNPACVNPAHLRIVTHKQNMENRSGAYGNSKSGVRGVHWSALRKGWCAKVQHRGKTFFVGRFPSVATAEAAVIAKRLELFTHNELDRAAESHRIPAA